jgi:two-component system, LytTR family, sensor kinase
VSALAGRETVFSVVASVFRRSPRRAKVYAALVVAWVVGMSALVVVEMAGEPEAAGRMWPALAGGFCGGISGILLGWTAALYSVAQDGSWNSRWQWRLAPRRMNEMMLALPTLAFTAGVLATAGGVAMLPLVVREWYFVAGFFPMPLVLVFAARMTADSTRFLYHHAREQAAAAERARAEAADAQLAALQAQVNPHFLFNALNTIASLVRTDARAAEATTENLARILRRTLDRTRAPLCTVEDELDYLRAYLSIEQERFGDRLAVGFEADPAALGLKIPTMTLQPLVENSLKHGIGGRLEGGRVAVRVRRQDGRLRLEVEDDGAGFPREPREGTGLANLRGRLETIYGGAAELRIERPGRGARVVVMVPGGD